MEGPAIPNWWTATRLSDVSSKLADGSHNPPAKQSTGLPMLSAVNINDNKIIFSEYRLIEEDAFLHEDRRTRIAPNDVLLTIVGAIGRAAVVSQATPRFTLQRSVAVITPLLIDSKFLMYQFESPRVALHFKKNARGTAQKGVYLKTLGNTGIWLCPLGEQRRLVAKMEELFSELDKGIESLNTARAQLKVYRQALLKHAFEGKLTAQWRAENRDKLETAATLLKRIQLERAQRYQQQLADWEAVGKQNRKPKAPKTLPPLTAEELAKLPELPEGWEWVKIGDTAETNVGFAFKSSEFSSSGIRLLRGENIEPRQLRWADTRFWPSECSDEFNALLVKAGEIIIAMDRPVISSGLKVTRVKQSDIPCLLVQRVTRIKEQQGLCTSYIFSAIDQNRFINHCLGNQTGTQLPHISEAQIRAYPVPLCAYEEQALISQELDSRMSEVDQLDQTIITSLQQAEVLRQSILKKAFSGQLVPQDPHDEPASALLAHIKAEKSAQSHSRKGRT